MKERLSSIVTPFYKSAPFVAGACFLVGAIYNFSRVSVGVLMGAFIWCVIAYLATRRWKNVFLENDALYVSNFLKQIRLPLAEIQDVNVSSFWRWQPRTIKLNLKTETEFGRTIVFVPRFMGYEASEIAKELKHRMRGDW
ncbi:MAG TPA: hypothetical protein PLK30_16850 [Blastocatellia bacterium]|nr:hypothetical protein [Blastocatellia bacterium]